VVGVLCNKLLLGFSYDYIRIGLGLTRGVAENVKSALFTSDNGHGWVLNDGAEKCRREG